MENRGTSFHRLIPHALLLLSLLPIVLLIQAQARFLRWPWTTLSIIHQVFYLPLHLSVGAICFLILDIPSCSFDCCCSFLHCSIYLLPSHIYRHTHAFLYDNIHITTCLHIHNTSS